MRQQPVGDADGVGRRQHQELFGAHRNADRGTPGLPVGDELGQSARVQHCAREDVRADLGALLDDHHANVGTLGERELTQPNRGREPGRPGTDDDDIVLQGFAL